MSLFLVSSFTGPDDSEGAFQVLYYVSRPVSWAVTQLTARLENWVPASVFPFLVASGVIFSGMLLSYVIVRTLAFLITKCKVREPAP